MTYFLVQDEAGISYLWCRPVIAHTKELVGNNSYLIQIRRTARAFKESCAHHRHVHS